MKIHWNQPSTLRGAIWLVVGIAGLIQSWGNISIQDLMYLGATVAGGMGVMSDDNKR